MSNKIAIIKSVPSGDRRVPTLAARGRGKSARTAATRALLNLLKQPQLRRQGAVHIQIELSIISTAQEQSAEGDRSFDLHGCRSGER